jgi:hypothetical protein
MNECFGKSWIINNAQRLGYELGLLWDKKSTNNKISLGSIVFAEILIWLFVLCCRTTTTTAEATTEDYADYEPLFSLGVHQKQHQAGHQAVRGRGRSRVARQISYQQRRHHPSNWEVRDINCNGVPFTRIPGKVHWFERSNPCENYISY